jgi:repressor LexA
VLPEYLGRDCAVRLATGETYIKQLMKGSDEGRFTLFLLNAPPIENVEVTWATPVAFNMPFSSRHLF